MIDCGISLNSSSDIWTHRNDHDGLVLYLNSARYYPGKCSSDCEMKNCQTISEETCRSIRNVLEGLTKSMLVKQESFGLNVRTFRFGSTELCAEALKSYFGISKYLLDTVFKEFRNGTKRFVHQNTNKIFMRPRLEKAISIIKYFSVKNCENLPDRKVLQMPGYMIRRTLYQYYKDNCAEEMQLGERHFYNVLKDNFTSPHRKFNNLQRIVFPSRSESLLSFDTFSRILVNLHFDPIKSFILVYITLGP